MNGYQAAICHYVTGLTLACLAVMAVLAARQFAKRQAGFWLAGLAAVQGAIAWIDLLDQFTSRPWLIASLHLLACAATCIALIELGQRALATRPIWLLGRWAYIALGGIAVICLALGKLAWVFDAYLAVLVWQGGAIGLAMLTQSLTSRVAAGEETNSSTAAEAWAASGQHGRFIAQNGLLVAALLYIAATCLQLNLFSTLAALMVGGCAWYLMMEVACVPAGPAWARRYAAPGAFLLLAIGGGVLLSRSSALADEMPAAMLASLPQQAPAAGAGDAGENDDPSPNDTGEEGDGGIVEAVMASPQLRRFGMAVFPIVGFVLVILALSRSPLAR
jgi:hypothetical protein